jgi:hypothetical protein
VAGLRQFLPFGGAATQQQRSASSDVLIERESLFGCKPGMTMSTPLENLLEGGKQRKAPARTFSSDTIDSMKAKRNHGPKRRGKRRGKKKEDNEPDSESISVADVAMSLAGDEGQGDAAGNESFKNEEADAKTAECSESSDDNANLAAMTEEERKAHAKAKRGGKRPSRMGLHDNDESESNELGGDSD